MKAWMRWQDSSMKAWTRWQDWAKLVLGVILFLTPWIFGTAMYGMYGSSSWNAWIVGVITVIVALWTLAQPDFAAAEWVSLVVGVWLFIAPWVLRFAGVTAAAWTAWIIGVLTVIAAGWVLAEMRNRQVKVTA